MQDHFDGMLFIDGRYIGQSHQPVRSLLTDEQADQIAARIGLSNVHRYRYWCQEELAIVLIEPFFQAGQIHAIQMVHRVG